MKSKLRLIFSLNLFEFQLPCNSGDEGVRKFFSRCITNYVMLSCDLIM